MLTLVQDNRLHVWAGESEKRGRERWCPGSNSQAPNHGGKAFTSSPFPGGSPRRGHVPSPGQGPRAGSSSSSRTRGRAGRSRRRHRPPVLLHLTLQSFSKPGGEEVSSHLGPSQNPSVSYLHVADDGLEEPSERTTFLLYHSLHFPRSSTLEEAETAAISLLS